MKLILSSRNNGSVDNLPWEDDGEKNHQTEFSWWDNAQCHSHDVLALKGYCDEDDSVDNLPGSDDGDEIPKNKVELENKGHHQKARPNSWKLLFLNLRIPFTEMCQWSIKSEQRKNILFLFKSRTQYLRESITIFSTTLFKVTILQGFIN